MHITASNITDGGILRECIDSRKVQCSYYCLWADHATEDFSEEAKYLHLYDKLSVHNVVLYWSYHHRSFNVSIRGQITLLLLLLRSVICVYRVFMS